MPGFALEVIEVTTLLALCGCAAAAVAIARRVYRSATERNAGFALEAALVGVAALVSATLFFNHQPPRQIRHVAPPWTAQDESCESRLLDEGGEQFAAATAEERRRRGRDDSESRARQRAERSKRVEQMLADRRQ